MNRQLPLLFLLTALACGPTQSPRLDSRSAPRLRHDVLRGTLSENIEELQASSWIEDCDHKVAAIQKELAETLDAHQSQIQAFIRSQAPEPNVRREPLGPTTVRITHSAPPTTRGWQEHPQSWSRSYGTFQKIKDQPVSHEWVQLNEAVRSLILDDQFRRVSGVNLYLDKDSGPPLQRAINGIAPCANTQDCLNVRLDDATFAFLENNPYYSYFTWFLKHSDQPKEKRDSILALLERLKWDAHRYAFQLNETVQFESFSRLVLPLDAGPFAGHEEALARYIEPEWTSDALSVKILWRSQADHLRVFKFLFEDAVGERAWVDPASRIIQLYPDTAAKGIAHEIGHVLGFPDHYYTVWRPQECGYAYQYREDDLMSEIVHGRVTAEEWATLREKYPLFRYPE